MPKHALAKATSDPLALRIAALTSLMDHILEKMRHSRDRIREARIAVALARDAVRSTEPTTAVRRRDLSDLKE